MKQKKYDLIHKHLTFRHQRLNKMHTHSWHVFRRKFVGCVRYEQAGFTDGTIADNHTLDGLHVARLKRIHFCVRRYKQKQTKIVTLVEGTVNGRPSTILQRRHIRRLPLIYAGETDKWTGNVPVFTGQLAPRAHNLARIPLKKIN